jgi:hypothetical protein
VLGVDGRLPLLTSPILRSLWPAQPTLSGPLTVLICCYLVQPILVEEPSPQECLELLAGLAPRYEAFHRVALSQEALAAAVAAAQRYVAVFQRKLAAGSSVPHNKHCLVLTG